MLLFAHAGITLGTAVVLAGTIGRHRTSKTTVSNPTGKTGQTTWIKTLGRYLDIRLLIVGSLLPDIIDKPVGQYILREAVSSGRIYCHTLLFLILITALGWYLYQHYHKTWMLVLSFGTLAHLVLDRMWEAPKTLLWPLFGFAFSREDLSHWILSLWEELLSDPALYVPELVGLAIVIWFVWALLSQRKIYAFFRYGRVP
jgi:hypothetical protein